MKIVLTAPAALAATPTLAHTGVYMHPHASDTSWLALLISGMVVAGAATLAWAGSK